MYLKDIVLPYQVSSLDMAPLNKVWAGVPIT